MSNREIIKSEKQEEGKNHSETMADIAFQSKVIAIPSITTKEEAMTHPVAKSQRKVGKKISLATPKGK